MLSHEIQCYQSMRVVTIMSELAILAASMKTALLEVAKQAQALGIGLQNAAPGDKSGVANDTIAYLLETAEMLRQVARDCDFSDTMQQDLRRSPRL